MTAHDVRRLRQCCLCRKLGIYQPKNPGVLADIVICLHSDAVPRKERKFAHPRCFEKEMTRAKLLTLSPAELSHIRLCDVSKRTMRALLDKK